MRFRHTSQALSNENAMPYNTNPTIGLCRAPLPAVASSPFSTALHKHLNLSLVPSDLSQQRDCTPKRVITSPQTSRSGGAKYQESAYKMCWRFLLSFTTSSGGSRPLAPFPPTPENKSVDSSLLSDARKSASRAVLTRML